MEFFSRTNIFFPYSIFALCLYFLYFDHLDSLNLMPGNVGDARLNNYFLENTYQFLFGNVNSLWNLNFYSPFPYVLGFSDNLFGSSPVYIAARLLGLNSYTAFQIWFVFGYFLNFIFVYYVLRKLNISLLAATVGAIIFTFSLPTTAHAAHAQLHYRFALPVAVYFFICFFETKSWRYLVVALSWLLWQFYCGIYMGFFTSLLMITILVTFLFLKILKEKISIKDVFNIYKSTWILQTKKMKYSLVFSILVILSLFLLLFFPYFMVSHLYGAIRSWNEIATMLPRPQSYFLSDMAIYRTLYETSAFASLPMRHEHKMFIGIFPLILLLGGLIWGKSKENETIYVYMSWMIILIVSTTLSIGGFSFWYLLHKLPLFNSIRAVTRIDQALLLPSAYLAAIFVDRLSANFHWGRNAALVLIVPGLLLEANTVSMITSSKMDWERRIDKLESSVPSKLSESPVFFFAQRDGPNYADEIDAMWVSMNHGVRTLNGYSGLKPPNYSSNFGRDCSELPKRILSYLEFIDREGDLGEYKRQISKVIPIGFSNCDPSWFNTPPETTKSLTAYSPDQFKALNFKRGEIYYNSEKQVMTNVIIENPSEIKFSVLSETNHPIKVSWRYLDPSGKPLSGYDTRENIRFDIPAHGNLAVSFPLVWPSDKAVSAIQISIVQEGLFWGHDIGIEPLVIKLDKIIG